MACGQGNQEKPEAGGLLEAKDLSALQAPRAPKGHKATKDHKATKGRVDKAPKAKKDHRDLPETAALGEHRDPLAQEAIPDQPDTPDLPGHKAHQHSRPATAPQAAKVSVSAALTAAQARG